MGYTTEFTGSFQITPPLSPEEVEFLQKFSNSRRMKREGLPERYGIEGEFHTGGDEDTTGVVDYNQPPRTQPGLWCQWIPSDDGTELEWDGGEKFYHYPEWLKYIIENFMTPKGHSLSGEVTWEGEDRDDKGSLKVVDGKVLIGSGKVTYAEFKEL